MTTTKFYSPDPPPGGGTPPPAVRHTGNVPQKDDDLDSVCQSVKTKWLATPEIKLIWMTAPNFGTLADAFHSQLAARKTAGGSRSPITDQLETVDSQIDDGTREVKAYIADKFGVSHATANYAPFGIVHVHQGWDLPHDHDHRGPALQMMADAVAANGFGTKTFGTAFWTGMQTEFNAKYNLAKTTDMLVSSKVSDKNVSRTQLRNVLHSILLVLEGNYPDTFADVKRTWGFLKQDF